MDRSIGLGLYLLAAGRRARGGAAAPAPPRPEGTLVWLAALDPAAGHGLGQLARRLAEERPGLRVLLSAPGGCAGDTAARVVQTEMPEDATGAVRAFLDHWRPDAVVLTGGRLRPVLVHAAARRAIPLLLAEAPGALTVDGGSPRWWPGVMRALLRSFARIFALDEPALRALRRAGAPPAASAIGGRLEAESRALGCNEAERAAVARSLGTRPAWLAAALPMAELDMVAAAHLAALRMTHRLLLILVPADLGQAEAMAARLIAHHGLIVARRGSDDELSEETQVYIADTEGELGLWYRLAPIAWLGGTLAGPGCLRHPFEAAALGAAIVHGPVTAPHAAACADLSRAGGSRVLKNSAELGETVGDLLAPDRAARLARAAWEVESAGVEATDQLVRAVLELLPAPAPANGTRGDP